MKKLNLFLMAVLFSTASLFAGGDGYEVGDKARDFKLKNTDGEYVSLADFKDAKGFILIFTCNGCPYAVAYQQRIVELDKMYSKKGFPVVALNPNDTGLQPIDDLEGMKKRAKEEGFTFPYLKDDQGIFKDYGATRTPHVYVLNREGDDYIVSYIGAIDDNYKDADAASEHYVRNAVDALLAGKKPEVTTTKAIGCTIKTKM